MKSIKQSGFTLFEILGALAVAGIVLVGGSMMANDATKNISDNSTAQLQKEFTQASIKYIQANFNTIATDATETTPRTITFAQLSAAGFISGKSVNSYGQSLCTIVLEPTDGTLRALVVTEGGNAISEGSLNNIAKQTGSSGGFISSASPTVASGTYGKWSQSLTNYNSVSCSGTITSAGHLANLIIVDNGSITEGYLYRNSVPGKPELNTMRTPLVIGTLKEVGNDCTSDEIGAIAVNTAGSLVSCDSATLKYKSQAGSGSGSSSGGSYWSSYVATHSELPVCDSTNNLQVKAILDNVYSKPSLYVCYNNTWQSIGVDKDGKITNINKFRAYPASTGQSFVTKKSLNESCLAVESGKFVEENGTGGVLACQRVGSTSNFSYQILGNSFWLPPVANLTALNASTRYKTYGSIAITTDNNEIYYWNGSSWVELEQGPRVLVSAIGKESTYHGGAEAGNKYSIEHIQTAISAGGNSQSVTALCPASTYLIIGYCSGFTLTYGSRVFTGTGGWSCTTKSSGGTGSSTVKATAYCGNQGD